MKHSMQMPFWLLLTPRQGPTGTCVLRMCVFDMQIGHGVTKLRLTGLFVMALQLSTVLAFLDVVRCTKRADRLTRHAQLQSHQIPFVVKPRRELAQANRAEHA
jgi:hypothetical protein